MPVPFFQRAGGSTRPVLLPIVLAIALLAGRTVAADETPRPAAEAPSPLRADLVSAGQVTPERLEAARAAGRNAVVLMLQGRSPEEKAGESQAAGEIKSSGLALFYWIEIARNPDLAEKHPEWMASLQGHRQWRRFFPDLPQPGPDEVVKTFPWVPIVYREAFEAHRERVERLLDEMPAPRGIFLNDLQAGPSACGCGHPLCRWTAHYGPIRTATPLGANAAAEFVAAVGKLAPEAEVIPVWATECEEHDGAQDGLCAGVGCFQGICWRAWTEQLMPVVRGSRRLGALLLYRELQRDVPQYDGEAGWVSAGLRLFQEMPPKRGGRAVPADRLIAVLEGWDSTAETVQAQVEQCEQAGTAGYVVALTKIDQGWTPRIVKRNPQRAE